MGVFSTIHDFRKAGTLAKQSLPYQDPTYLGFVLLFQWTDVPQTSKSQNLIHNSGATPHSPLFDPSGAEYYLKNLAQVSDADAKSKFQRKLQALQSFKAALKKINKDMPWYWQTLGGLEKLQQINPLEPYIGGDESKIAIGCLESVNMAITGLMRLYKEAVFDEEKWTYVVPANLRKFAVTIYVTEIRELRMKGSIKETASDSSTSSNPQPKRAGEILSEGFKKSFGKNDTKPSTNPNIYAGGELKPDEKNIEPTYDPNEDLVGEYRKPYFAFHLTQCEFDITSGTTAFESLTNVAPEMSTQLISFNYERLWQVDKYALNGIVSYQNMMKTTKNKPQGPVNDKAQDPLVSGSGTSGTAGAPFTKWDKIKARAAQDLVNLADKKKREAIDTASNAVRDATGIPFSMDGMKPKLELEGVYQNFVNKLDQATNIQRLTSKALSNLILGNVYFKEGETIGDTLNNAVAKALGNVYKG
jgi:hypothetical protein